MRPNDNCKPPLFFGTNDLIKKGQQSSHEDAENIVRPNDTCKPPRGSNPAQNMTQICVWGWQCAQNTKIGVLLFAAIRVLFGDLLRGDALVRTGPRVLMNSWQGLLRELNPGPLAP